MWTPRLGWPQQTRSELEMSDGIQLVPEAHTYIHTNTHTHTQRAQYNDSMTKSREKGS